MNICGEQIVIGPLVLIEIIAMFIIDKGVSISRGRMIVRFIIRVC